MHDVGALIAIFAPLPLWLDGIARVRVAQRKVVDDIRLADVIDVAGCRDFPPLRDHELPLFADRSAVEPSVGSQRGLQLHVVALSTPTGEVSSVALEQVHAADGERFATRDERSCRHQVMRWPHPQAPPLDHRTSGRCRS